MSAPSHRVTNAKGLFYSPNYFVAITEAARLRLLDTLDEAEPDPKLREKARLALEAAGQLPLVERHAYLCPLDPTCPPDPQNWKPRDGHWHRYEHTPVRAWIDVGTPKSASDDLFPAGSVEEMGWEAAARLRPHVDALKQLLARFHHDPDSFHGLRIPAQAAMNKKAAGLRFELIDPLAEIAEAHACALFIGFGPGREGGYLDSKGHGGPLARARLFESAAAAERTAKSHRFSSWKVVGVSTCVEALHDCAGDSQADALASAMAHVEAKALSKALEQASVEALRERLAQLEAGAPKEPPASSGRSRL